MNYVFQWLHELSNYRRHLVHHDVKYQIIDVIWYTIIVSNRGKYLFNTSATSCDCESIQLSSLRIILFPQLLEIFSERNGFIVLKNFLLPFCLSHRCRKYVLIDFLCNFTTLFRQFIYIALYCLLLLFLKCFPLHLFRWLIAFRNSLFIYGTCLLYTTLATVAHLFCFYLIYV